MKMEQKNQKTDEVMFVGSIYGKHKQGYDGSVYDSNGICPTILINSVTNNKMYVLVEEDEEVNENLSCVCLGNIYGEHINSGWAGNCWSKEDLCPTIKVESGGGNRVPMIIEEVEEEAVNEEARVKRLGNLNGHTGGSFAYMVYDPDGVGPTLNCMGGGGREPMIVEEIGFMDNGTGKHQSNTVYNTEGLSPNITTVNGGGTQQIKILEEIEPPNPMSDRGQLVLEPVIVASRGRSTENPSDRTAGIELEQRLEVNTRGTSNALTSIAKDNYVLEPTEPEIERIGQISSDGSQYGTVVGENGISATIAAGTHGYANSCIQTGYRIRKLTPKETWRLQSFYDKDFKRAEAINSNTALYKMSGNAISRNVVVALFGQLFEGKEDVYKDFKVTDLIEEN